MLLILPFHALVLIGLRGGLNDVESSVLWVIHVFRLPLFFLIAGFFAALLASTRGTAAFLRNRATRIGIPLLVGVLVVAPPITLEVQSLSELPHRPDAQGMAAFVDPHPSFLWFLWYLALIYAGALLIRRALVGLPVIKRVLLRAGERLLSPWYSPLLLAVPTALMLYRQPTWIPDAPAESFALHPDLLGYYAIFFAAGWLLLVVPGLREAIERSPWRQLAISALTLPPALTLYLFQDKPAIGANSTFHLLALVLFSVATWSLILGLLGLARRFGSAPNHGLRYWTDASYWIYLSHFPVMAAIALVLTDLAMPEVLRVVLLVALTLAVIYPAYGACVRHTAVGRVLHGPRARTPRPSPAGDLHRLPT